MGRWILAFCLLTVSLFSSDYQLPNDHPAKPILDQIFSKPGVLANRDSFKAAGFKILLEKQSSHGLAAKWILAKHPAIPGQLFKLFLDNEPLKPDQAWKRLLARCKGAEQLRNLIRENNLHHFTVPDKWLYKVPKTDTFILMVTEMKLVNKAKNEARWQNVSHELLDQLYTILSHGLASTMVLVNIPYTQEGKFACIDTEGPMRPLKLENVKSFIKNRDYWSHLMQERPLYIRKSEPR